MLSVGANFAAGAGRTASASIAGSAEPNGAFRQTTDGAAARNANRDLGDTGENNDGLTKSAETAGGDRGVKAYEAAAAKLAAQSGGPPPGSTSETNDPQVAAALAELKASDAAVRAHEAAHVSAGGSYVRGGASFTYQKGPDGQQYAVGGEVAIDTSPVAGDPQATILKMITVRAAALAPADPSAADRAVAAAASRQESAARLELLAAQREGGEEGGANGEAEAIESVDRERSAEPAGGRRAAEQFTAEVGQQARSVYEAILGAQGNNGTPLFQAAA